MHAEPIQLYTMRYNVSFMLIQFSEDFFVKGFCHSDVEVVYHSGESPDSLRCIIQVKDVRVPENLQRAMAAEAEAARNARAKVVNDQLWPCALI